MSRSCLPCHPYRPWIAFSLLVVTIAAYASTSPFQALSSSQAIVLPALPTEPDATTNHVTTNKVQTDEVQTEAIVPPAWNITPCDKSHPVACLYSNRGLVSHLEQEFVEQEFSTPDRSVVSRTSENSLEQNQEITNTTAQPIDIDDVGRKIRVLIQLKTWVDTIFPTEPGKQV